MLIKRKRIMFRVHMKVFACCSHPEALSGTRYIPLVVVVVVPTVVLPRLGVCACAYIYHRSRY